MKLLIDIGNSRLKWALDVDGEVVCRAAGDYRQHDLFHGCEPTGNRFNPTESPSPMSDIRRFTSR